MFSSKKGMAFEQVGKLLLLLIGAIVLIFILLYVFAPNFFNDYWPCKLNVLFRAKIPGIGITSPLDLRMCKTSHNEINEKNDGKIAELLADQMGYCWGKYWNGKVDFFSDWHFGKDSRCMICNVNRFNNFDGEIKIKDVLSELNKKEGFKSLNFISPELDRDLMIKKDLPFYTVFQVRKESEDVLRELVKGQAVGGWTGLIIGGVGGFVVGCIGGPAGCILGSAWGAGTLGGIGVVTGGTAYAVAKKGVFIPGVYLFNGDVIKEGCTILE